MARIKLGAILQDIRGKLGDQAVYTAWKSGVHSIRQMPTAVHNPNSADQLQFRENMSVRSKSWRGLSDEQRAGWGVFAEEGPGGPGQLGEGSSLDIIKANGGVMSGINAFIFSNQKLEGVGAVAVGDAPIGVISPSQPIIGAVTNDGLNFTVPLTESVVHGVDGLVAVWVKPRFGKEFHPQICAYATNVDGTVDVDTINGVDGNNIYALLPVGYQCLFQLQAVDLSGRISAPSAIGVGTIEAPI